MDVVVKDPKEFSLEVDGGTLGSVSLGRGERVAILGGNGAGKSTLLRALAGVRGGAPRWNGAPLLADRARHVAWLPQEEPAPPGLTVLEAVTLGRAPHVPPSLREPKADSLVLEMVAKFRLESLVHRELATLSGGERKRVALARVFAQSTEVLLLDEPFAPLDAAMTRLLLLRLAEIHGEGRAYAIALHDPNLALEAASRAILLEEGRVVADGPIEAVLNEAGLARVHGPGWAPARRESDGALRWVPQSLTNK